MRVLGGVVLVVAVAGTALANPASTAPSSGTPAPWQPSLPLVRFAPPPARWDSLPRVSKGAPAPWPAPAGCGTASMLGGSRPIHPGDPRTYDALIQDAAKRHRIDAALVKAVIKTESAFDHRAVSPAGAMGLMQLMPTTANRHGVHDVFAPRENVEAGCRHLRWLLDRYGGNERLALAAYNAGEGRVDERMSVPPIAETRDYVERVLRYRAAYKARTH